MISFKKSKSKKENKKGKAIIKKIKLFIFIKLIDNIELVSLSVGISCIIYFIYLLKPRFNYLKECFRIFHNQSINPTFSFSILIIGIILSLFIIFFRLYRNNRNVYIQNIFYIIWAIFAVFGFLLFLNNSMNVWIFIVTTSWLIYTSIKICEKIYCWVTKSSNEYGSNNNLDSNQNIFLAKLTFVWGVIAAVIGFILRK